MDNLAKLAMSTLAGLAVWAASAGMAASQEPRDDLQPVSTDNSFAGPCQRCPNTACRETGNSNPPNLSLPPECWPPQCQGTDRDQFDPLKTQCPDKDDYYIEPPRPTWYVVADGAAIRRDPRDSFEFQSLGMIPTGTIDPTNVVLSTGDFNYDFRSAGRLTVGRTINDCLQIEGTYFGVSESEDQTAIRDSTPNALGGVGNLFSPFGGFGTTPIAGLDYNNFAQIRYTSSLQGVELNVRRLVPMPPGKLTTSILFGIRYFGLPEDFQYSTSSVTPVASSAAIRVRTDNQMIGPQIGALLEFYGENRWWINVEMKGAVMNNRSRQSTLFQNTIGGVVGEVYYDRQEDHTTFAGELALTFVYRWSPHLTTRLGYQALWLENLALAPDNLNTDLDILTLGPAQLNHSSGSVYHGPFAGIALGW